MNRKTFKISTGEKLEINFPTSWEEITLLQMCQIWDAGEAFSDNIPLQLSILTKTDKAIWEGMSVSSVKDAYRWLSELLSEPMPEWENLPFVRAIQIGKGKAMFPSNEHELIFGAVQDVKTLSQKEGVTMAELYPFALAACLAPDYSAQPYTYRRAKLIEKPAGEVPAHIAIPAISFFFGWLKGVRSFGEINSSRSKYLRQKLTKWLGLTESKPLESSQPLMPSRAET